MDSFFELSVIITIALLVSVVMRLLRQPLIIGYIIAGVIVGPYALHVVHDTAFIELFSKIGITTLLFIIGISLNPIVVREVGKIAMITGIGQVVFTSVIGYALTRWLGFGSIPAIYIAVALTFSSTIIILKLLSDKGDVDKLYGKISIGLLLVQDVIATIILITISTLTNLGGAGGGVETLFTLGKGIALTIIVFIVGRHILSRLTTFIATSQELLFVFTTAWGIGLAGLFAAAGLSIEIGALIAGVAFATSPFAYEIASRFKPLRDFFLLIFFVLLGYQITVSDIGSLVVPAIVLSLFVLIGNPIIVYLIMHFMKFKNKVGFMTGLTVAQISEFSLILMALGYSVGHVSREVVSLVTLVGIVTIAGSTYLILYNEKIFSFFEKFLRRLDVPTRGASHAGKRKAHEAIIFGYDRVGSDFEEAIRSLGASYVVVDFNPQSINRLEERDIPHKYGDAEDIEFLREIRVHTAKLVVSTIPNFGANMLLVSEYRRKNESGIIIVISHTIPETRELYLAGASYVVMPHYLGAHHASAMIKRHGFAIERFEKERNHHLARLAKRAG